MDEEVTTNHVTTECLDNFVIISHGITARMLLMRYFKWTVDEYHLLFNPDNCEVLRLELQEDGHYKLVTPLRRSLTKEEELGLTQAEAHTST